MPVDGTWTRPEKRRSARNPTETSLNAAFNCTIAVIKSSAVKSSERDAASFLLPSSFYHKRPTDALTRLFIPEYHERYGGGLKSARSSSCYVNVTAKKRSDRGTFFWENWRAGQSYLAPYTVILVEMDR